MSKVDCGCLGRACIDFFNLVNNFPLEDSKVASKYFLIEGGGQASTAAALLAHLGLNTYFIGTIGDDKLADFVIDRMTEFNVNCELVRKASNKITPSANIIVADNGSRTIVYQRAEYRGIELNSRDLEVIGNSDCILLDPQEMAAGVDIAGFCKENDTKIVCDIERPEEEQLKMAQYADFYVASQNFIRKIYPTEPIEKGAEDFSKKVNGVLIVTLGAGGSIGFLDEGVVHVPSLPVEVKDTTGAGDNYHAGICYGIVQDWPVEQSMHFASIVAALTCTEVGGRRGFPEEMEVLTEMKRRDFNV